MKVNFKKTGRLVLKSVPWMNKLEFETVYRKLYSDDPLDQRWAVDRISAWEARGHSAVPLGVHVTEFLVRANIQDYTVQHNITTSSFSDVPIMYGMALIRFVNLIAEQWQHHEYNLPLRDIAHKHGIPDWIIQLRHQATHSSFPSLEKLRSAAAICLNWLDEYYWKPEFEKSHDYCPVIDDADEHACREALSDFQSSQYQALFGTAKPGGKRGRKPDLTRIIILTKQNRKCLINTLVKDKFLFSWEVCSRPLLGNSASFIREAVALPRNIERFWQPVISVIHEQGHIGELVSSLLKSVKNMNEENQRMAMAWVWKIVEASCESWSSSVSSDLGISEILKGNPPIFNWFELMDTCLHSCSKYMPAVLPIIVEHVFPPIPYKKKNCLMGLVAISTGALADIHSDSYVPKEDQGVYTVDNIKTVLELQEVVDRGETALYHTENPWKLYSGDINWAGYPLGHVFGLENENGVVGPSALELGETSQGRTEDKQAAAVGEMEYDVSKSVNESMEVSIDNERIEEDFAVEDESYANEYGADYCNLEDIYVF